MNVWRVREIVDFGKCVDLEDGIFADKDGDVRVVGFFLPIVPVVEAGDEKVGWFVMMRVSHCACWDVDCIQAVLIVCS